MLRVLYDGPGKSYANHAFLEPYEHLELPDATVSVATAVEGVGRRSPSPWPP